MNRVHGVRSADIATTITTTPADASGHRPACDRTPFNQYVSNDATAFGASQPIGFVPAGTVTDAAGYAETVLATDPSLFHDAGRLINNTYFAGFTGHNDFARPLASTSVYGPSPPFSTVDAANSADTAYLANGAGFDNGSGFVGPPNGEGPGSTWFCDGSGITGIAGFNEFGRADGFVGELASEGGLANVGGFGFSSAVDGLDSADGFMAVDATGVVGTFPLDDAFDWSTIDPTLDEFDNADTSTDLNGHFNGAIWSSPSEAN